MDIQKKLDTLREKHGWDDESIITLLLDFIGKQNMTARLDEHLDAVLKEQV